MIWFWNSCLTWLCWIFNSKNNAISASRFVQPSAVMTLKFQLSLSPLLTTAIKDILQGFDAGANDYVVRPRDYREIISRIRANLPPEVLIIDNYLCVDLAGSLVYLRRGGSWQEVHLQRLVFELLKVLIVNAGLVMLTTCSEE